MILGRADTAIGEVVLRRRAGVDELVVNGVFAMDSAEVSSEVALADAAGSPPGRVLVGGLGLGFTVARLLASGATEVLVAELAEPLVRWARQGRTDQLGRIAADPRVRLVIGDVVDVVASSGPGWDAIVLDVDNGPSFLIHDHNERVYRPSFLRCCLERLAPEGRLLIWCEGASPGLETELTRLAGQVAAIQVPVRREGRRFEYVLYRARPAPDH